MADKVICPQCGNQVAKGEIRCPRCYQLLLTPCNGSCSSCQQKKQCKK